MFSVFPDPYREQGARRALDGTTVGALSHHQTAMVAAAVADELLPELTALS